VNKQISNEAPRVLYGQAILHLRCDLSLRTPFPADPLQTIRKPMNNLNNRGDKLSPQVLQRLRRIRLTFLVGAVHDSEPDSRDIQYEGYKYAYTPCDMQPGIKGLKDVLSALTDASEPTDNASGKIDIQRKASDVLQVDLEWPAVNLVKRCNADEFDEHWRSEGIWAQLKEIQSIGRVEFRGSANTALNRKWLSANPKP